MEESVRIPPIDPVAMGEEDTGHKHTPLEWRKLRRPDLSNEEWDAIMRDTDTIDIEERGIR